MTPYPMQAVSDKIQCDTVYLFYSISSWVHDPALKSKNFLNSVSQDSIIWVETGLQIQKNSNKNIFNPVTISLTCHKNNHFSKNYKKWPIFDTHYDTKIFPRKPYLGDISRHNVWNVTNLLQNYYFGDKGIPAC